MVLPPVLEEKNIHCFCRVLAFISSKLKVIPGPPYPLKYISRNVMVIDDVHWGSSEGDWCLGEHSPAPTAKHSSYSGLGSTPTPDRRIYILSGGDEWLCSCPIAACSDLGCYLSSLQFRVLGAPSVFVPAECTCLQRGAAVLCPVSCLSSITSPQPNPAVWDAAPKQTGAVPEL